MTAVGAGMMLLAFVTAAAYEVYGSYSDTLRIREAEIMLGAIDDAAERVQGEGVGSQRTITVVVPQGIRREESYIGNRSGVGKVVNVRLFTWDGGYVDVHRNSRVDLSGDVGSMIVGKQDVIIRNEGAYALVTRRSHE